MSLHQIREMIRAHTLPPEAAMAQKLQDLAALSGEDRARISDHATALVRDIRSGDKPGLMEVFLAEYGLSTDEGVALMCLAEALLRVPDADTMDALIEDKIAPSDWGRHLGHSASPLVNASTWALMLTGRVLDDARPGIAGTITGLVKRLGEPVIRTAVARAMKEMGRQFVLGETIGAAITQAKVLEAEGYSYSYDMLGEAAKTEADAAGYQTAYRDAIAAIAKLATGNDIRQNAGISVKLSALYPRYETPQKEAVMHHLVPRLAALVLQAAQAGVGLNIDAEEADRLDLSLDVIEAVLSDPALAGWDGFGVVVQAYGPRAPFVIDWLYALAQRLDRKIMVRLVKGAYWDTEIKRAQVMGLDGFPVFTRKPLTDLSYIANARKLLSMTDRIYPQFATHNAHTVAAILDMADDPLSFEFQRLHGMGERLHDVVLARGNSRCRIYAPVGAHRDLLAYLVRRLLENGANSSFVNQIVDKDVPSAEVAADPIVALQGADYPAVTAPSAIFPGRLNSQGWDWTDPVDLARLDDARAPFKISAATPQPATLRPTALGPEALRPTAAVAQAGVWQADAQTRSEILLHAAELYEGAAGELFACLATEAGKTLPDCIGELREAVDFLRYYAGAARAVETAPKGIFACISPWNFPLAIFTGQIAAALAAGNAVIAKPAGQTPQIARLAVDLLHRAGVPPQTLHLVTGGPDVGAALTADPRIAGVCFTGSTATAKRIHTSLATDGNPEAVFIAETGGLNAMIVDSTALPEQVTRDVIASAFQSAGQRCSALRCLYVQEDVADDLTRMIQGAMDMLVLGDPWVPATDIGPIIDAEAHGRIADYIATAQSQGRLLHQTPSDMAGNFIAPALIKIGSISEMGEEIFGPVVHIATFEANALERVIGDINATGYGLTFGLHSRIDDRVQQVVDQVEAGNIYVNRNQIGAVVGAQPFGGEGLSGTGPKAGGPLYLQKFTDTALPAPQSRSLPGPTGEDNRYHTRPRQILCLGPDIAAQRAAVEAAGGVALEGEIRRGIQAALWWGARDAARRIRQDLAALEGPIVALITGMPRPADCLSERHACVDTTASGGNAALLAEPGELTPTAS